jgi:hypothetical protein
MDEHQSWGAEEQEQLWVPIIEGQNLFGGGNNMTFCSVN